jgi:hypothetical protein
MVDKNLLKFYNFFVSLAMKGKSRFADETQRAGDGGNPA